MTASQTFLVFDELGSFDEDWAGIWGNAPQLRFVLGFSHDGAGFEEWRPQRRGAVLTPSSKRYRMSTGLTTVEVDLEVEVEVVFARLLPREVSLFPSTLSSLQGSH